MKKSIVLVLILAGVLAGCASLEDRDTAVIRVVETGGSTGGILTQGVVATCTVYQAESGASAKGNSSVRLAVAYSGQRCAVQVQSK